MGEGQSRTTADPERRPWLQRNLLWLLPVGCGGVLVLLLAGVALVWVGVAICVVVGLWGADRLALWAEARGWIFYRKTRRQTGANLGDAFLEIQSMLEPDRRHLLEVRRQEKAERTEAGDPPDDAPPGNR